MACGSRALYLFATGIAEPKTRSRDVGPCRSQTVNFPNVFNRLKDFLDLTLNIVKGFEQWDVPDTK